MCIVLFWTCSLSFCQSWFQTAHPLEERRINAVCVSINTTQNNHTERRHYRPNISLSEIVRWVINQSIKKMTFLWWKSSTSSLKIKNADYNNINQEDKKKIPSFRLTINVKKINKKFDQFFKKEKINTGMIPAPFTTRHCVLKMARPIETCPIG